ncbi:hypothetical protein B9Z19DRAFT_124534 [Tuber borchii]|uniref:Secreted protein n=1 Tax=Tuber borchii TaxID=42251 RepID=A0A2T6ZR01_TUBBO|nr:hypothetical protein B9Z19DRAFT_124534 [Tuber borchii]
MSVVVVVYAFCPFLSAATTTTRRRQRSNSRRDTIDTYTRTLCCTGTVPAIILYSYSAHYLPLCTGGKKWWCAVILESLFLSPAPDSSGISF